MSTIEHDRPMAPETAPPDFDTAVETELGRLTTDLAASLGVLLHSLGTRSGLWAALAGAGPLTTEQVAARVDVDRALVREWLRAQAAGGYLEYDAARQTFALSEPTAAVLVHGPGGPIVEACISLLASMTGGFDDFSGAFARGEGYGWHQRTAAHWQGVDALTRATVPTEVIAAALQQVPDVQAALDSGGTVLDVGCGYGAPTQTLARLHPEATVVGIDYHDASIMHAREEAAEASLANVSFEVAAADQLPARDIDLITYFDSLHDMGDAPGALAAARSAVSRSGAVLLFEPVSGDSVSDNFHPGGRMFYAISTLACTPNAVAQRTATSSEPLGAQAGERTLRTLASEAGFATIRRLDVSAPLNLVLELRP